MVFITKGGSHGLAIRNDGILWAWGYNDKGQLGNGDAIFEYFNPLIVSGIPNIISVAGGQSHTIALTSSGDVYTWGSNQKGQLGDGKRVNRFFPSKISVK